MTDERPDGAAPPTREPDRLPRTRFSQRIGAGLGAVGFTASWLWPLLMVVIVVNVAMRYLAGQGRVEFEEIQWHLYSAGFLLALAAAVDTDSHVRVDVLHARLSLRARAWVELYGLLLLFFPFVTMVLVFSVPFVHYAYLTGETSDAPGGLPWRWVVKSLLPVGMALLLLAGMARLSRVTCCLFGRPGPIDPDADRG